MDSNKKKEQSGKQYKQNNKSSNLFYQLIKGLGAICILISLSAFIAMVADLYLNNTFVYFNRNFFKIFFDFDKDKVIFELFDNDTLSTNNLNHYESNSKSAAPEQPLPPPITPLSTPPQTSEDKTIKTTLPVLNKEDKSEVEISEDKIKPLTNTTDKPKLPSKNDKAALKQSGNEKNIKQLEKKSSDKEKKSSDKEKNNSVLIAIIIDDIGFDLNIANAIINIDKNITIAILPYSPYGRQIAKKFHFKGIETMLHLPMEPLQYPSVNPGYGAVLSGMKPYQIANILKENLLLVPYIKGVNNHMGSKLTSLYPEMLQIFKVIKRNNLFFVDSLTSNKSKGSQAASAAEVPFASRDVFLDNIKDKSYIKKQLKQVLQIGIQKGKAIAIGHPYNETYLALKEEIPKLRKYVKIVPVSQLVAY